MLAGGNWNNATNCSSRSRNANNARSHANTNIGRQGRIRGVRAYLTRRLNAAPCRRFNSLWQNTQQRGVAVSRRIGVESGNVYFMKMGMNMRRYGNLWQEITSKENLIIAHHKATLYKKSRRNIIKFNQDIEGNLAYIREILITKQFHTSPYYEKTVYEPKKRIIYVLPFSPDRIVQHALMNIIIPILQSLLSLIHTRVLPVEACTKVANEQWSLFDAINMFLNVIFQSFTLLLIKKYLCLLFVEK